MYPARQPDWKYSSSSWADVALSSPIALLMAALTMAALIDTVRPDRSHAQTTVAAIPPADHGAPPSLPRAPVDPALLRALLADPEIAQFRGLAENSWDFTRSAEIPGFGDLRREVDQQPAR